MFTKEQAARVAGLEVGDLRAIIKLASLSLAPAATLAYAQDIVAGKEPDINGPSGKVHPITIQLYSFLKDYSQYNGVYGLTAERAGGLLDLCRTDEDAAVKQVTEIVAEALRRRGSPRAVLVTTVGKPVRHDATNGAAPTSDGGLRLLRAEVRSNSGLYGSYKFAAQPTGRAPTQAFSVDLGGSLFVFAQSKDAAVAAARIVRVKGRKDELVIGYTAMVVNGTKPVFAGDVSESIWDGRLGPSEPPPPPRASKAKTEMPVASEAGPSSRK